MTALSNLRWVGISQGAKISTQLLGLLIFSRLLSPSTFGLVAMATTVTNFAGLIRDLGTASAIIERRDLVDSTSTAAFWLSLVSGLLVGAVVVIASPILAGFFQRPELAPILCVAAISFPLASSASVHQALLERDSRFETVARIEVASNAVGLTLAVIAAWCGAGAYSIVLQTVVTAAMSAAQLWNVSRWRPGRPHAILSEFRGLWRYSGGLVGFNFVNYFSRNADGMIIGRLLGPAALGPYSVAYRLMLFPVQNLTFVANRALFPLYSRKMSSVSAVREMYLRAVGAVAGITMPLMAGAFILRVPFVEVVLGSKWKMVATLLAWMAPVGLIQSLLSTTGSVFMSAGRTVLLMKLGLLGALLQVSSFLIGVHWGVEGVARCYLIANVVNAVPVFYLAMNTLHGTVWELLNKIWKPFMASLFMVAIITIVRPLLHLLGQSSWLELVGLIVVGASTYAVIAVSLIPGAFRDLRNLLGSRGPAL